jgi:hypothetical protein
VENTQPPISSLSSPSHIQEIQNEEAQEEVAEVPNSYVPDPLRQTARENRYQRTISLGLETLR